MVTNLSDTRDWFCGKIFFSRDWGLWWWEMGGWFQVCYIYCALLFYYYYISSTSDHQTLNPGDLMLGTPVLQWIFNSGFQLLLIYGRPWLTSSLPEICPPLSLCLGHWHLSDFVLFSAFAFLWHPPTIFNPSLDHLRHQGSPSSSLSIKVWSLLVSSERQVVMPPQLAYIKLAPE